MKLKIHVYFPERIHYHDTVEDYYDCLPFSVAGIKRHFELVGPDGAQLYYLGSYHDKEAWQLHENRFEFLRGKEKVHCGDCEGDWRDDRIPDWLSDSPFSAVHIRLYEAAKFPFGWVRPTFSFNLCAQARAPIEDFVPPTKRGFQFIGQLNSTGSRLRMGQGLEKARVQGEVKINQRWMAEAQGDETTEYKRMMREYTFALTPIGEGPSARYFEACGFGRFPILIGDYALFGSDVVDTGFVYRISETLTPDEMSTEFQKLWNMDDREILDRCRAAKDYFDGPIREYFKDPTLYFLKFMERRGLL